MAPPTRTYRWRSVAGPAERRHPASAPGHLLGLKLNIHQSIDFTEWMGDSFESDITMEDDYAGIEDDMPETSLSALEGIAQNLDDWAENLESRLPGITAWAESRGYHASAQDLGEWIYGQQKNALLLNAQFLDVAVLKEQGRFQLGYIKLNPGIVTNLWGAGNTSEEAERHIWIQAYRSWQQGQANQQ